MTEMLYVRLVAVAFNLAVATAAAYAGHPLVALFFVGVALGFLQLALSKLDRSADE